MHHNLTSKSEPKSIKNNHRTKGVEILLGNPKRAIIKLAWPMIIAMSVHTIYNVVDAIWVSGLGADALAAVGFFFPFFFMAMAIGVGLGIGGGSAISRRIGANDKKGADQVAIQTLVFMVVLSIIFTIPFFIFAENIFTLIGAGETVGMATAYGRIMFAGTIIIFFTQVANALLRAEGDAKRAMYAMMLGADARGGA
jgi:Na+-driven multidrug efflux pump